MEGQEGTKNIKKIQLNKRKQYSLEWIGDDGGGDGASEDHP